MSVYLVDNTKRLERLDDVGYRRMSYRLIIFYKISREMRRRFWDVPLSRFYSYKRLDGVDDELIYKIFTNMTSDEAIDILKKFESKMVFIDEILTHLIWRPAMLGLEKMRSIFDPAHAANRPRSGLGGDAHLT